MGKGQVSVGDDTPTGEPENGPRGPASPTRMTVRGNQGGPATTVPAIKLRANSHCQLVPRQKSQKKANSAATDQTARAVEARQKKAKLPGIHITNRGDALPVSMYSVSVPIFIQHLTALSAILDKAAAYAEQKKIDPSVLLGMRLYPDMYSMGRQVHEACRHPSRVCGMLAGVEGPAVKRRRHHSRIKGGDRAGSRLS